MNSTTITILVAGFFYLLSTKQKSTVATGTTATPAASSDNSIIQGLLKALQQPSKSSGSGGGGSSKGDSGGGSLFGPPKSASTGSDVNSAEAWASSDGDILQSLGQQDGTPDVTATPSDGYIATSAAPDLPIFDMSGTFAPATGGGDVDSNTYDSYSDYEGDYD